MKVNYDTKRNRFSITDLTNKEAGALAGALSAALVVKKSTYSNEENEKAGMGIVEDIERQLVAIDFMRSAQVL